MSVHRKVATAVVTMSMGFVPAVALANGSGSSSNAKQYGKYCLSQNESKQHVAGQPGTPFSACVKALAKLANGSSTNPKSACATETKKHVAGQKGTPFSNCVAAAAQLEKSQDSQSGSGTGTTTTSTTSTTSG